MKKKLNSLSPAQVKLIAPGSSAPKDSRSLKRAGITHQNTETASPHQCFFKKINIAGCVSNFSTHSFGSFFSLYSILFNMSVTCTLEKKKIDEHISLNI